MNITSINNAAISNTLGQEKASPIPQGNHPTGSPSGLGKIYTLKPPSSIEKAGEKKENKDSILDAAKAKELVEGLNEYMDDLQTNLGFSIREDMDHQVVVEIKNRQTEELIRQIPSEELLKIKEKMEELSGFIFDQSV